MTGSRCPFVGVWFAAALLAGALSWNASAAGAQVTARLGADQIYVGESVEYQVTLQNMKEPSAPDLSAFAADFDVATLGSSAANQSLTISINGQVMQQSSMIYAYRLTPKRAGTLSVPAPVATSDGRAYSGPVLTLRVAVPEKQDLALVEIIAKPAKVYPTQPFDVTLRVFIKPLPDAPNRDPLHPLCQARQPPALQIGWENPPEGLVCAEDRITWLKKYFSEGDVGFTINGATARGNDAFAMFDRPRLALFNLAVGREKRNGLDGKPLEYYAYELKRTFTAKQAGSYIFGPASLKGQIVDGLTPGRRGQYSARQVFAVAPAQTVEVRPVPTPRPPTFCGGIGICKVTTAATPQNLRVGDPLTLTLAFEALPGSGSLDLISAPDLSANVALAEGFDVIDRAPTGETKDGIKRFSYGLRPKKVGPGIPRLAVTFFNPQTESFTDAALEPITLNITQSAQLNAGELVGSLQGNQPHELRTRQEGIFQNIADVAELRDQRVQPFNYLAAVAAMWVCFGALSLLVGSWRRKMSDAAWQRRQSALPSARQRLAEAHAAAESGRNDESLRAIRSALVGLIADMLNRPAAGMTTQEAAAALDGAGVAAELKTQTLQILESMQALEYGSAAGLDCAALRASVEELLPRLQKELEARR